MKWTFSQTHLATLALVVSAPLASESREIESLQAKYVKIITLDSCIIIYVPLLKPRGQFFKTSVGANSPGVGANFSCRRENPFKKLPSAVDEVLAMVSSLPAELLVVRLNPECTYVGR
jgi:hypothetical protein